MKIGIAPVNIGMVQLDYLKGVAKAAEDTGIESVWTFEHVVVPVNYDSVYPYDKSGKMAATPETPFVDPLIALTAIATCTEKLQLCTGVNILTQMNPLYLAKQAASLDVLSGGRLQLGLGIGWLREEFRAMGVPYERRGKRFDDYVEAMRKVWSGDVVEHKSDFLDWENFKSYPLPVKSDIPIILGGDQGKTFDRIARYGNGWLAAIPDMGALAEAIGVIKQKCEAIGRDFNEIEISAMSGATENAAEAAAALEEIGVSRMVLIAPTIDLDPMKAIDKIGNMLF